MLGAPNLYLRMVNFVIIVRLNKSNVLTVEVSLFLLLLLAGIYTCKPEVSIAC